MCSHNWQCIITCYRLGLWWGGVLHNPFHFHFALLTHKGEHLLTLTHVNLSFSILYFYRSLDQNLTLLLCPWLFFLVLRAFLTPKMNILDKINTWKLCWQTQLTVVSTHFFGYIDQNISIIVIIYTMFCWKKMLPISWALGRPMQDCNLSYAHPCLRWGLLFKTLMSPKSHDLCSKHTSHSKTYFTFMISFTFDS